jgi:hypothetical protein
MPDLMRIGGVTGWMRSAAIAGASGHPMSSHLYPESPPTSFAPPRRVIGSSGETGEIRSLPNPSRSRMGSSTFRTDRVTASIGTRKRLGNSPIERSAILRAPNRHHISEFKPKAKKNPIGGVAS